jgi:hypothetical protein
VGEVLYHDDVIRLWQVESSRPVLRLKNSVTEPLDDRAVLHATLAFANGSALFLEPTRDGLPDIREVARQGDAAEWPSKLWQSVGAFLHEDEQLRAKSRAVLSDISSTRTRSVPRALKAAISDDAWICRLNERPVVYRRKGVELVGRFSSFEDHRAVVARGITLFAQHDCPALVGRCKLGSCGVFFVARQNPKGGPPNRIYCRSDHRDLHHNSAARKKVGESRA